MTENNVLASGSEISETSDQPDPRPHSSAPPSDHTSEVTELAVDRLLPADSPRLTGEDEEHIRVLADSEEELPPILVHGPTLRVIDGMHRLRAAKLRGERTIRARLFDGTLDAAFVAAVQANVTHGLPLSFADREAAAARILAVYAHWSDRAIASVSGISARTVGTIRRRATGQAFEADTRVGRDGRVRPVNGAEGRRRAGELFERRPNASVREVAREAGISAGTAWDVRARVSRGENPVPERLAKPRRRRDAGPEQRLRNSLQDMLAHDGRDRSAILNGLRKDPTLRFTDSGRCLLRWLDARAAGAAGWEKAAAGIPLHCGYVIADLAYAIAKEWLVVAERMRSRADGDDSDQAAGATEVDGHAEAPPARDRPSPSSSDDGERW